MIAKEVTIFLKKCRATLEQFQADEERIFPENLLLYRSAIQIMDDFNHELNLTKGELVIIPTEVYVSFFDNGSVSVNLGETLLGLRIDFRPPADVKLASRLNRERGSMYSYEREFGHEYNLCIRQYEHFLAELKKARPISGCPYGELLQAMDYVYKAQSDAFVRLSTVATLKSGSHYRKKTTAQIGNMQLILDKLKRQAARRRG
jgi:hypothetical protein